MPRTSAARSTGRGSSAWRRAKASRRWVSAAPRWAPCSRAVEQRVGRRVRRQALPQQLEIAEHRRQQVVEIVRHAAGELRRSPPASARGGAAPRCARARRSARSARLACRSSAVRSSTRCSSWSRAARRFASPRRRLDSSARASYWRRRPLSAVRATLTRVVGWNGRSTKVTLPRRLEPARGDGIALRPAAALGQQDEGQVGPGRLLVDPAAPAASGRRCGAPPR